MIREPIRPYVRNLVSIFSIVVLVAGYAWMCHRQHEINPRDTTIPNWAQFKVGWEKITHSQFPGQEPWLISDLDATVSRHLGGLLVGSIAAIVIGIAMGVNRIVEAFFWLPIFLFSKVPPTAMMAVYFVLFGTEYKMFVAMIALGIFPIFAQSVYQATTKDVSEDEIHKAYTLGASHIEVVYDIIFKRIAPRLIEAVRMEVGPALVFLIAAETLVSDVGFGYRLRLQSHLLNMNVVYIYLAILAASFTLIDIGLQVMRHVLCPWYGE